MITFPLGARKFLQQDQELAFAFTGAAGRFEVVSFTGYEAINSPFELTVQLASEDGDIDLETLLDKPAHLGIYHKYQDVRHFHGIVVDSAKISQGHRRSFYEIILRPAFARLELGSDSRIWQGKTVPEIAREVLKLCHIQDVSWNLTAPYQPREYLTQYNETHREFLERILAEEGIFYYFEHLEGSHRMVFSDAPLALPMIKAQPEISYNANPGGTVHGAFVNQFSSIRRLRSTHYSMNDYTFHAPAAVMTAEAGMPKNPRGGALNPYYRYEYPGRYKDPARVGTPFTRHRIAAARTDASQSVGQTNAIHLCPGYQFILKDHEDKALNARHRLLQVTHEGHQSAALEEDAGEAPTTYRADFITQPGQLPYRPEFIQKPLIHGPQIAIITGPKGEEIYCDEHGRVKIWFPWDRHSPKNEQSSCWIRVSQNWAGANWGHIAIPRIGQEVIVEFLDGDIDQPIITGRTYHATNRSPYKLPENKTRMSIKSKTHKGEGFNELRFEDEAGREEVFIHAQKDMNIEIENDHSELIGGDSIEYIRKSKIIKTTIDKKEIVDRNQQSIIGGNSTTVISGNVSLSIGYASQSKITQFDFLPVINSFKSSAHQFGTITNENFGRGDLSINISHDSRENIGRHKTEIVGKTITTVAGDSIMISAGKNLVLSAGQTIEIGCGASKITLSSDGSIMIDGVSIKLKALLTQVE